MSNSPIPVNQPLLDGNEKKYLDQCIDTGWISSEGPFVKLFESKMANLVDRSHAVAVTNGSCALDLAVTALDIKEGDEVIMPAFTIISCATATIRLPQPTNAVPPAASESVSLDTSAAWLGNDHPPQSTQRPRATQHCRDSRAFRRDPATVLWDPTFDQREETIKKALAACSPFSQRIQNRSKARLVPSHLQ